MLKHFFAVLSLLLLTSATLAQPAALDELFESPPRDAKPWVYWMWLGTAMPPEALTRDLEEMHAKGIVGAMVYQSSAGTIWRGGDKMVLGDKEWKKVSTDDYKGAKAEGIPGDKLTWWMPAWRASIRHAAKECNRLGIDLCIALGTTGPRTAIGPQDGQQSLEWTVTPFSGPGPFSGKLKEPKIKMSEAVEAKLTGEPFQLDVATLAVPASAAAKAADVIDLTSRVKPDGTLVWTAPPGDWKIYRFAQIATRKGNALALQIDGMSTEALDKAWAGTMAILLKEMTPEERAGLKFVEEDSWEAGEPTWTKTFAAEFKKRRGYDLIRYLPILADAVLDGEATVSRVKADYQLTISDLIADNHYGHRKKIAEANGLPFWCEAAGPNMKQSDLLKNTSRVTVGMAEFWMPSAHRPSLDSRFLIRSAATANHTYGRAITPCEAFTSVGPHWEESLFDMKSTADQGFCDGMNRIAFHNFAQNASVTAKPGYTMWAGTHYEPGVTWWEQTPAFNAYLNRCSTLLQQGLFSADALFYQGDTSGFGQPRKMVLPTLGEGYDSDNCNTEVLLTRTSVKNGQIVLPDGMSYRVLVLPEGQPMRPAALEKVVELINAGATVVGPKPTGMEGLSPGPVAERGFAGVVKKLWTGDASGETKLGAGRLVWGKTAREVLQAAGYAPDFEQKGLSDKGAIDWIHRTVGEAEVYFVTSRWFTPEKIEATFRVTGKQPELWNAVTGEMRDATAFKQADGRTIVPLEFDPCGSTFVVFRKPIAATATGPASSNYATLSPATTINGAWDVSFDSKWGGPASVKFDELVDWTKRPEDGIKFYSGTAVYKKTFDLPAGSEGQKRVLDLGQVHEVASVKLNGKDLGVVWTKPSQVDITAAAKAGANELEVTIVNLWPNRLIGDASLPPEQRRTVTNMRKFMPQTPLLPSGLIGPVKVLETKP